MYPTLSNSEKRLIDQIINRGGDGVGLQTISKSVGLAPPTVLAHLRKLVHRGLLERLEPTTGRSVRYRCRPFFEALLLVPDAKILTAWSTPVPVNWEFPLASRIPDPPAQRTVLDFLGRSRSLGLLGSKTGPWAARSVSVVVYGSCATGTARPGSDLDLLVLVEPARKRTKNRLADLAADTSLSSERPVQLRVETPTGFRKLPEFIRNEILRDGITVFSTEPMATWVESHRGEGGGKV